MGHHLRFHHAESETTEPYVYLPNIKAHHRADLSILRNYTDLRAVELRMRYSRGEDPR